MKPKDQGPKEKKSRVIYSFQCNHIAHNEEYLGEIARTLGERCKEHLKQPSPIHVHGQQTGHSITDTSFNIIGREDQLQARTIKESIFIRVNVHVHKQGLGLMLTYPIIIGLQQPQVSIRHALNSEHVFS